MKFIQAAAGSFVALLCLAPLSQAFLLRPQRAPLASTRPSHHVRYGHGVQCTRLGLWMADRVPFIGGNWKCNGTKKSVADLVKLLNEGGNFPDKVEVVVAPPALHVGYVQDSIRKDISVSTQNVGLPKAYGAYTGELSGNMIKDFGVNWCITGHSERREGFGMAGESSELVAKKTKAALEQGLKVIPCVGEKKEEREAGKTMDVISEQMKALVAELSPSDWSNVVVAYEPVWAIGTGLTATPQQAQDTQADIRKWMADNISPEVAASTRIIYGGSVKAGNAAELFAEPDIDGFLVGGASLTSDFIAIINASTTPKKA
ncbi:unnamed protein product [Vitrella brassicaformis CCMP3155]|uniref:Triosephosphate isomerase n=1 Tax=Vitrella brassicaformis (strain CCMP3155) TaxID=1169540 RepID=A0A0G4FLS5_VITBC|nr:unnamed protein product [Vitrella brassicaformis CCMP3155]|mmetsp:Transcript_54093/g.136105  ORF Transcript_54093/g.136105 Transcript_54093/m.136105 type:complete len:317 (-) Transcript_54093:184-1134(-)|eukprot:CEM14871.1 unnamed protein product [Vitrella brassicaformis CCMP3155]